MRILLTLAFVSSCAFQPYRAIYVADTAGVNKCQVSAAQEWMVDFEKHDMEAFENYSGYSECELAEKSKATMIVSCKKPTPYSSITTWKMADCHKFMNDNKIQVVR